MFEPIATTIPEDQLLDSAFAAPERLLVLAAIALCVVAAVSDLRRLVIPNGVSGMLLIGGLFYIGIAGAPWIEHIVAFVAVLILGYAVFALGVLGAGDGKLLAALALWLGPSGSLLLLFHTTLIGGLLALGWMMSGPARQALIGLGVTVDPIPSARIPYGIAIAGAAIPSLSGLTPILGA